MHGKIFELISGSPFFVDVLSIENDLIRHWVSTLENLPDGWAKGAPTETDMCNLILMSNSR